MPARSPLSSSGAAAGGADSARVTMKEPARIGMREVKKKCRVRINFSQIAVLELQYQKNPKWDTQTINQLASQLGLSHKKVYKWHWERVKKNFK